MFLNHQCQKRTLGNVEDELHFIIECPLFDAIRDIFSKYLASVIIYLYFGTRIFFY
jgi:hypothetical protein